MLGGLGLILVAAIWFLVGLALGGSSSTRP